VLRFATINGAKDTAAGIPQDLFRSA